MNAFHNYHELALEQLSIMYRSEHQYKTYLQIYSHKASSPLLKHLLFDLKQSTNYKLHYHHQLIDSLHYQASQSATEGLNGIYKEAHQLLDRSRSPEMTDAILLHTLFLSTHYTYSHYHILLLYFNSLSWTKESSYTRKMIAAEESILNQINALIKDNFNKAALAPELDAALV
ncbi:DUF892 family protein [Porifericola rhodea]|uniref:DUF892 family protein n=1 Tax=Porifericola rhodea TaxID=930972 RepID=UPI002666CBE8|nr:DUF892 family protein [Porifericola rhodea]WKN31099.1 DUF892 family protein [Porifericola rhodea]